MENHIIIGLGGTGGSVVRAFRKRMYSEYTEEEFLKVPIGFLYVDSSKEMMDPNDPTWKILGKNSQLGRSQQLFIKGASLKTELNNIGEKKGISSWLGNINDWDKIIGGVADIAAGAQRRRLGRFLFSCKINEFLSAVATQVSYVRSVNPGVSDITFHISAGLAGGTGSGSIVDVIAQLRKTYQPNISGGINFKIIPYLFIPEQLPKPGWDAGFYHSNGYAALAELNALALHKFNPYDINGNGERIDVSEHGDFFTGAYLYSNINEEGVVMDTKDVLPHLVSDFLFQKINLHGGGNEQNAIERTEGYENILSRKEIENNEAVRSRNFWSFGIKRIEIPEEEIIEYFTYNFSRQALLQFKYNNWSDDLGFRNQPRNVDLHSYINDKTIMRNWYLSDDHMMLSLPILRSDASQNWKTILEDWNAIIPTLKSSAWENSNDKTSPINQLSKFCEERFDKNFRRVGVVEFYKTKKLAKKDIAKEVAEIIERSLFDEWRTGQRSIGEVAKIIELLVSNTEIRLNSVNEKLNQIAEEIEKQIVNKQKNEVEWSKINVVERMLGKGKRVFEAHGVILQQLYTQKTNQEAWRFGRELLAEILNQLQLLNTEINHLSDKITQMIESSEKIIASRCQDEKITAETYKSPIIRYYDANNVKTFTNRIVKDASIQNRQSNEIRNLFVSQIGAEPTFTKFNERISDDFFSNTLENTCKQNALATHNELLINRGQKIIGVNILERLFEQYGNDQNALKDFVRSIIKYSGTLLNFNNSQESIKNDDNDRIGVNLKRSILSISIPSNNDISPIFKRSLETAFREATANPNVQFDFTGKPNEIVIISTVCAFPLRFVNDVSYIRQKHETLLKGSNEYLSRLVLYLEGDGNQHPKLFPLSDSERRLKDEESKKFYDSLAYYLIGVGTEIVKMMDVGDGTGKKQYGITQTDKYGREISPMFFGFKLINAYNNIDEGKLDILIKNVNSKINGDFLHISKRREVIQSVVSALNSIKAECNGNVNDTVYKEFLKASDVAINILEN